MKPFTSTDVVVIGGGVMGAATAMQLAMKGVGVILCEMRSLASGATGRCGGMVVHCYGRELNIDIAVKRMEFTKENTRLLKIFQQQCDIDYEFQQVGCLDIAASEEDFEILKQLYQKQRDQGDEEIQLLDKKATMDIMPTLRPDVVYGSRFRPSDGNLSPYKMVHAYAKKAKDNGAVIMTNTKVEKVVIEKEAVCGVITDKGYIAAKWVVNAANAWAPFLCKEAEVILPVREIACVTEQVGPLPPMAFEMMLNGEFAYGSTQFKTGNISMGGPAHPIEKRSGYYNEQLSIDEFTRLARYVSGIFPILANTRIIRAWAGTFAFAPDGLPCVGPSALTEGLLIAAGFSGGIAQGCAVGEVLTEYVTQGEIKSLDMSMYNPGRFLNKSKEAWPAVYDLGILHDYLVARR
jgi:sarcosine oxidase subunit beta